MTKEQERPKTSYIKKMTSGAGLIYYKELMRLAGNRIGWRNYKLQNQS